MIETRSGANDLHGTAFGLLRPRALDSEDWFAQRYQAPLAASSSNGYGASLGGALIPNRTFFFLAFENEHVEDSAMQLMAVPSAASRAEANSATALLLNAFPAPTGPNLSGGTTLATVPFEQQASVQNYSARIDQIVGHKLHIFARYSNVPSRSLTEQLGNISASLPSITATVGLTGTWLGVVHDFRASFSRTTVASSWAANSANEQAAFNALPSTLNMFVPGVGPVQSALSGGITALAISGVGQLLSGLPEDA